MMQVFSRTFSRIMLFHLIYTILYCLDCPLHQYRTDAAEKPWFMCCYNCRSVKLDSWSSFVSVCFCSAFLCLSIFLGITLWFLACRIRHFFHQIRTLPLTTDYIYIYMFLYVLLYFFILCRLMDVYYYLYIFMYFMKGWAGKGFLAIRISGPTLISVMWIRIDFIRIGSTK